MFNRDLPKRIRPPPTEAELAYVRALVIPFEQKFPADLNKPKRLFKKRLIIRLRDDQLLAEFAKLGVCCAIPARLLCDRMIAARPMQTDLA